MGILPQPKGGKSAEQRIAARAAFFSTPNKPLRPILTFINGDNMWLFSIPIPEKERAANPSGGRFYFHFVMDPWLGGKAIYKSTMILHYTQQVGAEIQTVDAIEAEIREIEKAAASAVGAKAVARGTGESEIDAIMVSDNEAPDHMNKETLLQFPTKVPIYCDGTRTHEVEAFQHFETVVPLKVLDTDHSLSAETPLSSYHPGAPLPTWITLLRLQGPIMPQFSAVIVFESPCEPENASNSATCHEWILYTPHGQPPDYPPLLNLIESQWPPLRALALMTPLLYSSTAGVVTQPGAAQALELERKMRPKYWMPTADSDLNTQYTYGGALSWVLKMTPGSLEKALEDEEKKSGKKGERPNFLVVGNGEALILDC